MQTNTTIICCEAFTAQGQQPCQVVQAFQCFRNRLLSSSGVLNHTWILIMKTGSVSKMLACLNHIMWLSAQKDFIEHYNWCRRIKISTCQNNRQWKTECVTKWNAFISGWWENTDTICYFEEKDLPKEKLPVKIKTISLQTQANSIYYIEPHASTHLRSSSGSQQDDIC